MSKLTKKIILIGQVSFVLFAIGTAIGGGILRGIALCSAFWAFPLVK